MVAEAVDKTAVKVAAGREGKAAAVVAKVAADAVKAAGRVDLVPTPMVGLPLLQEVQLATIPTVVDMALSRLSAASL